jgi:hypothetical protein
VALFTVHSNLPAWNGTGHRVVAAIAYDLLDSTTRARVDDLIRRHPDYQSMFLRYATSREPAARAREAFIQASIWPDQIKSDARFYDEDRREARPTTLLPGFPDMGRHQIWHFINIPFTQDGSRLRDARSPNIVTELDRLTRALAKPAGDPANPVYVLPWVLHLVGDIHNPMHVATRFTRADADGDRGGNDVVVSPGRNLHSFWDALAGPDPSNSATIDRLANQVRQVVYNPDTAGYPSQWAEGGVQIAKLSAYSFGSQPGSAARPITLSRDYQVTAKQLAYSQLSASGHRLAHLLQQTLH